MALALVVGSVVLGAAPANAATEQDVAAWITESTLENLNVTTPDADLAAALQAAISDALEAGVISLSVEDLAEQAIDDPESVDDGEIEEALDEELGEQGDAWDEVATAWHAAFDTIRADFAECREAAEAGANLCAHQFRYEMQVNHVTAWQARHAAKVGDITALPEDEQAAALAKLERQGEHAAARLDRARIQLEKKTGEPVEEAPITLDGMSDDVTDTKPGKADKAHKPDKGNGNGNKGSGNGKSGR
ncbi:MAG TPA: hypothetical protein VFT01_08265 [Homoserinimonas sp.]|nr:hypothetical protein [Homoserinimonas sp.]